MQVYAGIDLHSTNNYIGIINDQDQRLYRKRLPNDTGKILNALAPYKNDLKGVVVESTYNWYWLVDALQEEGYKVHLANPSAIRQYEGLKHTDDKSDSFWLAHMLRLNILPTGYIYPKEERPVRDLLRRRMFFVRQRTAQILSFQRWKQRILQSGSLLMRRSSINAKWRRRTGSWQSRRWQTNLPERLTTSSEIWYLLIRRNYSANNRFG